MKRILTYILFGLLFGLPSIALATSSAPWSIKNLTDTFIFPNLVNGTAKGILVSASSTINGNLSVSTLTNGNCVQGSTGGLLVSASGPCGSGGGSGLSTTSPVSAGNLLVYSATGAGSAFGVATGTVSAGSTAITVTANRSAIGGALTIDCATASGSQNGCLSSGDWTTFNNKLSSAITGLAQTYGSTQTGATQTLATSSATVNGLTYGLNITNPSGNNFTFTPTVSGTYNGQAGSVANSVTFNSGGSGGSSPQVFNGSGAETISYNTIGAQVAGNYDTFAYPFIANATTTALTFGGVTVTGAATGCATFTTGVLSSTGVACGSSSGSTYPFALIGTLTNATSTLTQFTGGLTAYSTSTIGSGTQGGGLTVNGGASTTLNQYTGGSEGIGTSSPYALLSINAPAQSTPYFAIGSSTSQVMSIGPSASSTSPFVGIGTTTPGSILSIGNSPATWGINFTSSTSTFSTPGGITLTGGCFQLTINGPCAGAGTVTAVSVATANGFSGSSSGGSTPALTLTGTPNVIYKVLNATTYYQASTTGNAWLFPNGFVSQGSSTIVGGLTLPTALTIVNGGTGQTTAANAFNALSPLTTLGDMLYGGASGVGTRLPVGTGGFILASLNGIPTWVASSTVSNISAFKAASNYATTGALPANTYLAGVLTEVGTGALTVDGASPSVGQRILVKNEATQTNNGIYTVTATGSGIAAYVLTRATDFNANDEIYPGVATYILSGTANIDDTWVLTTPAPVTLDVSNLTFAESANGNITIPITEVQGGTNQTTYATGDTLYASNTNTLSKLSAGTNGQVLMMSNGIPKWMATSTLAAGNGISLSTAGSVTTITNTGASFAYPFINSATSTLLNFNYASTSEFTSTSTTYLATTAGNVNIGTTTTSASNIPFVNIDVGNSNTTEEGLAINGNVNDFLETNIKNASSGVNAQSCNTATDNAGSGTTGFLSLCANSSKFWNPQTYNVGGPLDTSLMSLTGGDLYIDQSSGGKSIYFMVGGNATSTNVAAVIQPNQTVLFGTTTSAVNPPFVVDIATTTLNNTWLRGQLALTDNSAGTNLKHWFLNSSAGNFILATSTDSYATSTTPALFINTSGFVGFGTTSPYTTVTVGAGNASSSISVAEYDYGFPGNYPTSTSAVVGPRTRNTILWPIGPTATTLQLCGFRPGDTFKVIVKNPSQVAGALTWTVCTGVQIDWVGQTTPTQTTTANAGDVWSFLATDSTGSSTPSQLVIIGAESANW